MISRRWPPSHVTTVPTLCSMMDRGARRPSGLATIAPGLLGRTYFVSLTWHSSIDGAASSD